MAKTLKIVFDLKGTKTTTFSLPDPKDDITKDAVQTAAAAMIAKNFVLSEEIRSHHRQNACGGSFVCMKKGRPFQSVLRLLFPDTVFSTPSRILWRCG